MINSKYILDQKYDRGNVTIYMLVTLLVIFTLLFYSLQIKKEFSKNIVNYARVLKCSKRQLKIYQDYINQILILDQAIILSMLLPQTKLIPLRGFLKKRAFEKIQEAIYINYLRKTSQNKPCQVRELFDYYNPSPFKRNLYYFKRTPLGTVKKENSQWIKRLYFPKEKLLIQTKWRNRPLRKVTFQSIMLEEEDFSKLNFPYTYSL